MKLLASLIIVFASPIGVGPAGAPVKPAKGSLPPAPVTALIVTGETTALGGTARGELRRYKLDATPVAWSPVARMDGAVTALVSTPSGVAAATDAGQIALAPATDGAEPKTLGRHDGGVQALVFHETHLLSAGNDGAIRAWSLDGSGEAGALTGHTGPVTGLAIARGMLWSVGWDKTLRGWKLNLPKPGKTRKSVGKQRTKVVGGPRELTGVVAQGEALISACWDGSLRRWNVSKRKPVGSELPARPHQEWAGALAANPSRVAVIAPAESAVLSIASKGAVQVLAQVQVPSSLAFAGERLLLGRWDGTVGFAEGQGGAK